MKFLKLLVCATLVFVSVDAANAAPGDVVQGARVFQACMACHSVVPGEHMTGPSLAGVIDRKAGTAKGFPRYSDALAKSGLVWNENNLDKWLQNPGKLVPGTTMTFEGLRGAKDRQDLIAYLRAAAEGKAPQADMRGGGMMMNVRRADLKRAPPEGQVVAIGYCRDTYTLRTAAGTTDKIWEMNVRLKSDSSKLGPLPGKPVVVGAGMQGERVSIIFSSPAEISAFIKPEC